MQASRAELAGKGAGTEPAVQASSAGIKGRASRTKHWGGADRVGSMGGAGRAGSLGGAGRAGIKPAVQASRAEPA